MYINSQQKVNTAIYIHWTSTIISHIGPDLPYLNVMSNECTTRYQRHIKCSCKLAKIAQTVQNKHTLGGDAIVKCVLGPLSFTV